MAENQEGCNGPQLPPPPPVPPPPTPPLDGASGPLFGAQPSSVPIVMTPPEEELDGSNKVNMAVRVMEFSREGYKIRKIFA